MTKRLAFEIKVEKALYNIHIISHLKARGIGVLITDHNVRETLGICDRAYVLGNGDILADGSAEDILNNKQVREIYLGEDFKL